jgi:cysteine desulfurase
VAYLDANATEPLRPQARAAMLIASELVGNPSSVHALGRAARRVLEDARETLAAHFGARPTNLVFTSGGTEANALAIHGLGGHRRLIVSAVEHDAVRAAAAVAAHGAACLPVDARGVADLAALERRLAEEPPALVCLMLANNETGVIQPVAQAARLCRAHGALLHVDAVQAAGRIAVNLASLGAHSLALSSHKLGGSAGAGALLLAEDAVLSPLIVGGGQERGRRGGTPALPAIAGFAAAAAVTGGSSTLAALRDAVERAALAQGAVVCGAGADRLPNTTCLALPGIRADVQVIALDLAGVAVSAGAACSSGKVASSHVLAAMGLGPLAGQAIRVSLPWNATESDVADFARAYGAVAARLRQTLAPHAA